MLYYDLSTLDQLPSQQWIVRDVVPCDGLVVLYGVPGCCKTFIVIDLGLRIANGMAWCDREIDRPGIVIIVAAEGMAGIKSRVQAWHDAHGIPQEAAFVIVPLTFNLRDAAQVQDFVNMCTSIAQRFRDRISLVVFDTLARAAAGIDENSSKDVSSLVRIADFIKSSLKCTVMFVHHGGKDETRGMRGSSSLLGAVDTCIKVTRAEGSNILEIRAEKQKDGFPREFKMELRRRASSAFVVNKGDTVTIRHDRVPRHALMVAAKSKTAYELAKHFGRTVSDVRVAIYHALRESDMTTASVTDIISKYKFKDPAVLPVRTMNADSTSSDALQ